MNELIWVHDDCFDERATVHQLYPTAPSVYVFDSLHGERWNLSPRQVLIMYEALLAIPAIEICQGDVVVQVLAVMRAVRAQRVITMRPHSPHLRLKAQQLGLLVPVAMFSAPLAPIRMPQFAVSA